MSTNKPLVGAAIIGQSGGPSAVINASAYGVIKTALESDCITKVYGAHHGIMGVLNDRLMIMDEEDPAELELLMTPISSASWRSSKNITSVISSTMAATTPWTPATRSAAI